MNTPYTPIVPAVAKLVGGPPLNGKATLVVDHTGVGRPVVEMLERAPVPGRVVPVTITAGNATMLGEDGSYHVPKKHLVTSLQYVLQSRRLQVARSLPDASVLLREMQNFRVRITDAANETFSPWQEGDHDDLVLAVALACWFAERQPPARGGRSVVAEVQRGVLGR